jgi:hypothetical protein
MAKRIEKKVPFRRSCFEEALELRYTSIRKLGNVTSGIGWSEKTIRRGLKNTRFRLSYLMRLQKGWMLIPIIYPADIMKKPRDALTLRLRKSGCTI